MPKDFNRINRIESLVQETLAKIIQRELRDQITELVTITSVKVSRDLSFAKTYVVMHEDDPEKIKQILKTLNQAAKFLRFQLAKEVELRKIPALHFYYDEVWQKGLRVSQLLAKKPGENRGPGDL